MCFFLNKYVIVTLFVVFGTISTLCISDSMASEKVMHIPFQLDESYLPIANIEIGGKKHEFMIDTGSATALHLSKDLMLEISGLVLEPEKERSTDLAGKVIYNDKFNIPNIIINNTLFQNVKGVSLTPWGMHLTTDKSLPSSMVIGLGLFNNRAVLINYKDQQLSVSAHMQALGIDINDGWIELPLRLTQEGIMVEISQNAQIYKMVLDTGATASVFWKNRLKSPLVSISCKDVIKDMDNEECFASAFQLEGAGVKKININAVIIDGKFDHLSADGLVGNNFFQQYAVLIDFPGKRLFIKDIA